MFKRKPVGRSGSQPQEARCDTWKNPRNQTQGLRRPHGRKPRPMARTTCARNVLYSVEKSAATSHAIQRPTGLWMSLRHIFFFQAFILGTSATILRFTLPSLKGAAKQHMLVIVFSTPDSRFDQNGGISKTQSALTQRTSEQSPSWKHGNKPTAFRRVPVSQHTCFSGERMSSLPFHTSRSHLHNRKTLSPCTHAAKCAQRKRAVRSIHGRHCRQQQPMLGPDL